MKIEKSVGNGLRFPNAHFIRVGDPTLGLDRSALKNQRQERRKDGQKSPSLPVFVRFCPLPYTRTPTMAKSHNRTAFLIVCQLADFVSKLSVFAIGKNAQTDDKLVRPTVIYNKKSENL